MADSTWDPCLAGCISPRDRTTMFAPTPPCRPAGTRPIALEACVDDASGNPLIDGHDPVVALAGWGNDDDFVAARAAQECSPDGGR